MSQVPSNSAQFPWRLIALTHDQTTSGHPITALCIEEAGGAGTALVFGIPDRALADEIARRWNLHVGE